VNDSAAPNEGFRRVAYEVPGGTIAGVAFGAETADPDIVFLHATGFTARIYRTLLAPLGEKLHVVALDARGHGRTQLPAGTWGYTSWRRHRDDIVALLERHFTGPVTLAGHSMGGTVSLLIAGHRPDLVSSLALVDPVILPPAAYAVFELPGGPLIQRFTLPMSRAAAGRRNRFASRDEAITAFTGRGVFKSFPPEALADYVGDGLTEDGRGGFKLSCAPNYEAATFAAHRHDPWGALRRSHCPLVVLRAGRGSTTPQVCMHRIAALKPDARIATVEGASHMLPIERPDRVRAAIEMAVLMGGRSWREDVD